MTTEQTLNWYEPMQSTKVSSSLIADSGQLADVFQDRGFNSDEIQPEISKANRNDELLVVSLFRLFQKTSSNIEILPFSQRKG